MRVKALELLGEQVKYAECISMLAAALHDRLCLIFENDHGETFAILTNIPRGVPPIRQRSLDLRASLL